MKNKILNEELSRIKGIMFPGLIMEANPLGKLAQAALVDAVRKGVKNVIDDLFKTGGRETIERMAVNGASAIPPGKLQNKIYEDISIRAFGKSYNSLSLLEKSTVKGQVAAVLDESDDFIKQSARNKTFTDTIKPGMDDAGKKAIGATDDAGKKAIGATDDAGKKGIQRADNTGKKAIDYKKLKYKRPEKVKTPAPVETPPTRSWTNKLGAWAKTDWGKRILWGAATLGAGYLLWRAFWGDDDDIPPCMKFLVENEAEFEKFLVNGYVQTGNYRIYPGNKVVLVTEIGEKEGEWEFDESTMTLNLDFDGITRTLPCATDNTPETDGSGSGSDGSGGGSGSGSYRECNDFPIVQGCKGQKVRDIQKCLGGLTVDGKWGSKTQSKVESSGYGSDGVSQEEYNKIMEKCGKVDTAPENKPTGPELVVDPMIEK